jgi:xyloglucan:xyloglucosyl transferase
MAMSPMHLCLAVLALAAVASGDRFSDQFDLVGSGGDVQVKDDGKTQDVQLIMNRGSGGAGFNSKNKFLYGEFSVQMKLIGGNSAGTVTSLYLTSGEGDGHDEIDIEFMGNSSGQPYVMNTNVWASGDGKKEHQFYLWFDPSADFHTYKIVWNPKNIIFQVDDVPVRTFKKYNDLAYPSSKPMAVHCTLWDGSYWATEKGAVKIDWNKAPFVVNYRGYSSHGCVNNGGSSACPAGSNAWMNRELDTKELGTVKWAQQKYMTYNYCDDGWRFPQGFPAECSRNPY